MEAANFSTFLKFGNAKKSHLCYFCKRPRVATKLGGGGLEQNWGPVPPPLRPGPEIGVATGQQYACEDFSVKRLIVM